ncbi:MAG: TolC family outer membrane protein [Pigmentiphaga sp.]
MRAAVERAVHWHPLVHSARSQVLQAGEGVEAARSGYLPRLRGGVNSRVGNTTLSGYDSRHVHRAELTVSQTVYDFGKVDSQVDQAQGVQDVAQARATLSVDEVVRNTAEAWVEVRRQQAMLTVAQDLLAAVDELARLADERETQGAGTYSDTVQARVRVDAAQVELLTAQSQLRRWRNNLMHWVGAATLPEVGGAALENLDQACLEAAERLDAPRALATTRQASSIQLAEAQLEVARAGAELARKQLLPTLSVEGSAGRGLNTRSRGLSERANEATVMLNFSVPLYEGGRLQADSRAAEYAVAAARSALDQAYLSVDQGGQDAVLEWRKYASRLSVQAGREESMRLTRSLYRDQYLQLGTRSLLELLNAEQEYYGARSDQIDNLHEMQRLGLQCLYYTGRLSQAFGLAEARP